MPTFEFTQINNIEDSKLFFYAYNIPFTETLRGENKGMLRVPKVRQSDRNMVLEIGRILQENGAGYIYNHSNVFRDAEDRTVVTYSPYGVDVLSQDVADAVLRYGYQIEICEYSIYGYGTKTFVVKRCF